MSARQILNFVYASLTQGMTAAAKTEFDLKLAGPVGRRNEVTEKAVDDMNRASQAQLAGFGMPPPRPKPKVA